MNGLTAREQQVADLVAVGLSYGEIGRRLGMAPRTARIHVMAIDRKINAEGATPYRRVMRWMLDKAA